MHCLGTDSQIGLVDGGLDLDDLKCQNPGHGLGCCSMLAIHQPICIIHCRAICSCRWRGRHDDRQTDKPYMRCLSCCTCQDMGMLHSPGRNISTITDGIDNMAGDGYTAMNQCPDLLRDARPASWAEGKGRGGGGVVLPQSKWPGARRCRPWRYPDARLSLSFFSLSSLCLSDFVITFVICTLRADIPS